jgi:hypothetical protein
MLLLSTEMGVLLASLEGLTVLSPPPPLFYLVKNLQLYYGYYVILCINMNLLMFLLTTIFSSYILRVPTCVVQLFRLSCVEALIYGVLCVVLIFLFAVTFFMGAYSCLNSMSNILFWLSFSFLLFCSSIGSLSFFNL